MTKTFEQYCIYIIYGIYS